MYVPFFVVQILPEDIGLWGLGFLRSMHQYKISRKK